MFIFSVLHVRGYCGVRLIKMCACVSAGADV
jgi:hypothetical protein